MYELFPVKVTMNIHNRYDIPTIYFTISYVRNLHLLYCKESYCKYTRLGRKYTLNRTLARAEALAIVSDVIKRAAGCKNALVVCPFVGLCCGALSLESTLVVSAAKSNRTAIQTVCYTNYERQ